MSALASSRITVRGKQYVVRELTAREMAGVRTLLEKDRGRMEAYVASVACEGLGTETEVAGLPQKVVEKIAAESLRLTNAEDEGEKQANAPSTV